MLDVDSMIVFSSRFPSSPLIIRVPFFLLFGFNKGTPQKKGKRVLLGNLVEEPEPLKNEI